MLKRIESEISQGIGGVLQRMELGLYRNKVVAGFTQDDRPYLEGSRFLVSPIAELGPMPVSELMGRVSRGG
jgi:hypothetical protein